MQVVPVSHGERMASEFSKNLLSYSECLAHVNSRGISTERVEMGQVGYCPPFFDYSFPLLKGRIIVPIRDAHGRVIAFAGRQYAPMAEAVDEALWSALSYKPSLAERTIQDWHRGKWINERFPKGRHLYNLDAAKPSIRESNYVVVVEGYFDALVLASKYVENVVAVCGTSFTEHHAALIARYCEHVVLLLDGDEAGAKGAERSLPIIESAKLIPHVVSMPIVDDKAVDPDEFVLKWGGKQLRRVLDSVVAENRPTLNIRVK